MCFNMCVWQAIMPPHPMLVSIRHNVTIIAATYQFLAKQLHCKQVEIAATLDLFCLYIFACIDGYLGPGDCSGEQVTLFSDSQNRPNLETIMLFRDGNEGTRGSQRKQSLAFCSLAACMLHIIECNVYPGHRSHSPCTFILVFPCELMTCRIQSHFSLIVLDYTGRLLVRAFSIQYGICSYILIFNITFYHSHTTRLCMPIKSMHLHNSVLCSVPAKKSCN